MAQSGVDNKDRQDYLEHQPVKFSKETEEGTVWACLFCTEARKTLHLKERRKIR